MDGSPGTRLLPDPPGGPRTALVVATTRYKDPELRRLRAPAHDAKDLAEVLGDPGIGAFTVTQMIDADERRVRRAIDVFLSGRGVGDLVVVYLSCHGVLDRRNRLYFAASDTLKTQLGSTGIPAAWLMDELEECRARSKVLILDCCFSGAFAHGSKGDADLDLERRLAGHGRGQAVLTASRAGEYSFEGQTLPGAASAGSVFTAGLVEGLRTGAADIAGDGYVSVDEAFDYAFGYVQSSGASQTPQRWLYGGEGEIVLARSPAGIVVTPAPHVRTLSERFAMAADKLGGDKPPIVRLAGVYAMAVLADDWEKNRQSCIDVLCGYLRMPYEQDPGGDDSVNSQERREFLGSREVRHTVIRVIAEHLRDDAAVSWRGANFDFTGAVFDGGKFIGAEFSTGNVSFAGARFSGDVIFYGARFSGGHVSFSGAEFSDGKVSFDGAKFSRGTVSFNGAKFSGSEVSFGSEFSGGTVRFQGAEFSRGRVRFSNAKFSGGTVSFDGARFCGAMVSFVAKFSRGKVSFVGTWFSSGEISFDGARFCGGTVSFVAEFSGSEVSFGSEFSGGTVHFSSSRFLRGTVSFNHASFSGGEVRVYKARFSGGIADFTGAIDWSHPPKFDWTGTPPSGVKLPATGP